MDGELRVFLSGVYQILRTLEHGLYQQQVLTKALLGTIQENPTFAESYKTHYADALKSPLSQGHAAVLELIDEITRQIDGNQN
jgi:hypothetical protein